MSKYNLDLLWHNKDFDIQHTVYESKESMADTHYHTHYEVYYQHVGDRYYFIKDSTYYIKEGTLVYINTKDIHKTIEAYANKGERMLINFQRKFIEGIAGEHANKLLSCFEEEVGIIELTLAQKEEIEKLLFKMIKNNNEESSFYIQVLLSELLILSNQYLKEQGERKRIQIIAAPKYERVNQITKYLSENYSKKITLEEVAKRFYISPYYLSRLFKEGTGFNLINYINYVRINKAKELLKATELTITMIAGEVGFESTTHFDRVFKEIVGVSPLKYRKS